MPQSELSNHDHQQDSGQRSQSGRPLVLLRRRLQLEQDHGRFVAEIEPIRQRSADSRAGYGTRGHRANRRIVGKLGHLDDRGRRGAVYRARLLLLRFLLPTEEKEARKRGEHEVEGRNDHVRRWQQTRFQRRGAKDRRGAVANPGHAENPAGFGHGFAGSRTIFVHRQENLPSALPLEFVRIDSVERGDLDAISASGSRTPLRFAQQEADRSRLQSALRRGRFQEQSDLAREEGSQE